MASVGFRWLDILEKEFDKAFVDLDLAIGELDSEEPDVVYSVRQKLCTLSSCFAQLTHKAQTIFQSSAKIEAELIHMRAELIESKAKRELLEQELHNLLLQLHTSQLSQLPNTATRVQNPKFEPDVSNIKKKFESEIKSSPKHLNNGLFKESDELKFSPTLVELAQFRAENSQLQIENAALRNSIVALNSEVYGAKLAAQYLDKELAGRIQQLQLLGREMQGDVRNKLWRQLESEILLQRHKTVVRACRRNSILINHQESATAKPSIPVINEENTQHFGDVRTVVVKRKAGQGLGISITGGREHGVPILISELEPNGPAALSGQLYIGDAILYVNDRDLRQACHREAVDILQQQVGDCHLQVQYIAADDSDNSLEEDGFHFRFFDNEVCDPNDSISLHPLHSSGVMNTPTAPRTPESTHSRTESRNYSGSENARIFKADLTEEEPPTLNFSNNNENLIVINDNASTTTYNTLTNTSNDNNLEKADEINSNICENLNTENLILTDNYALQQNDNQNKIDLKKLQNCIEENLNCSTNSLISDNLSSPMQTSTDVFLDSEILSTDAASNDSHSPKNTEKKSEISLLEVKRFNEFCLSYKPTLYASNENVSNVKSDQSLLNSAESCDSSPVHKINRDYKKSTKKYKSKKHFGVKTLQSIFSRRDGYSDISSTASELGDDVVTLQDQKETFNDCSETVLSKSATTDLTPQFEENLHQFLSETFSKNFSTLDANASSITINKSTGSKKYFKLNGQNLRIGKALRLCPNDDFSDKTNSDTDQKKDKLLARYVYNSNLLSADGIGDPDFGTPV
ncbi:hypothetical protein RN001_008166 [Aquatica leii]|uniref:PDZ domain-containing protein n=1 Tax=Aquatica leii TaxID=1421715 RepID=A0AAN7SR91_9COLE|nr:hypothetical protein RN001_008166 [Aquatica leii]